MVRISKSQRDILPTLAEYALNAIFLAGKQLVNEVEKKFAHNCLLGNKEKFVSNKRISKHLYELKRQGYIYEKQIGNGKSVCITNKGKLKIAEEVAAKHAPDDANRYLSFDIPERLHRQRDLYRRFIKRIGFKQVQQSLWVINKNVGDLVEAAAIEYEVEEYIVYIVSNSSNIERHINKLFNK